MTLTPGQMASLERCYFPEIGTTAQNEMLTPPLRAKVDPKSKTAS